MRHLIIAIPEVFIFKIFFSKEKFFKVIRKCLLYKVHLKGLPKVVSPLPFPLLPFAPLVGCEFPVVNVGSLKVNGKRRY